MQQINVVTSDKTEQRSDHTVQKLLQEQRESFNKLALEALNVEDGDLCVIGACKDTSAREAMVS